MTHSLTIRFMTGVCLFLVSVMQRRVRSFFKMRMCDTEYALCVMADLLLLTWKAGSMLDLSASLREETLRDLRVGALAFNTALHISNDAGHSQLKATAYSRLFHNSPLDVFVNPTSHSD